MLALTSKALRSAVARTSLSTSATASLHTLPSLPYDYNALEPYISEEIMRLHHTAHHQAYVNGLNAAEEAYLAAKSTREQIGLQSAIRFNGGGHINHSLFWKNLAPASGLGGRLEPGPLQRALVHDFGSVDQFKLLFNARTAGIQGSGWGWLGYNSQNKRLEIVTTSNQDPLISHTPIIGVDIWEHAFYLQYKNVKPEYLKAIWHVINFKEAESRYAAVAK